MADHSVVDRSGAEAMRRDERGVATAETALASLAGGLLLVIVCWGLGLAVTQYRAIDAAGAVARQEARGNHAAAKTIQEQVPGSRVVVERRSETVQVTVTLPASGLGPFLPAQELTARASAVAEPGT